MSEGTPHLAYIDIPCPSCQQNSPVQIIDLVDRDEIACPVCGDPIDLKQHRSEAEQRLTVNKKFTELGSI